MNIFFNYSPPYVAQTRYSDSLRDFKFVIDGIDTEGAGLSIHSETRNEAIQTISSQRSTVLENAMVVNGLKSTAKSTKPDAHMYTRARTTCAVTRMAPANITNISKGRFATSESKKAAIREAMENHFVTVMNINLYSTAALRPEVRLVR